MGAETAEPAAGPHRRDAAGAGDLPRRERGVPRRDADRGDPAVEAGGRRRGAAGGAHSVRRLLYLIVLMVIAG